MNSFFGWISSHLGISTPVIEADEAKMITNQSIEYDFNRYVRAINQKIRGAAHRGSFFEFVTREDIPRYFHRALIEELEEKGFRTEIIEDSDNGFNKLKVEWY